VLAEQLEVHGNLHEHWTRGSGNGSFVSFKDHRNNISVLGYLPGSLDNTVHQPLLVDTVQLIAEVEISAGAAGNHQQRNSIEIALADAAHGVGHPGRGNNHQAADLSVASAADGICRKSSAALVRAQYGSDLIRLAELVVKLGGVNSGDAESM